MVNPFQALIKLQMRFWVQWLDSTQQMFHGAGLWGRTDNAPTLTPALLPARVNAIVLRPRGCVGPADLKG